MRKLLILIIASLSLLPAPLAFAWNSTGHMTVALMAWHRLSDAQKKQVAELLKHHPHYQKFLIADLADGVDADEWAFMRASYWPDWVRPSAGKETFKSPAITHYHKGEWHYINLFFVVPADAEKIDVKALPEKQEPNIVTALEDSMKKLESSETSEEDKAVALCWLIHLGGDIHQPLHACSMASAVYPKGDRGGNEQAIRANAHVMKLHAYWDNLLGSADDYKGMDAHAGITFIAEQIEHDPGNDPAKLPEISRDSTFMAWAQESHEYAVAVALLGGALPTAVWSDYDTRKIKEDSDVPALPVGYDANARQLAQRRCAAAAYRLAGKLGEVFKPQGG